MIRTATGLALALLLALLGAGAARAATLQPVGNFSQPTYVTSDPGNPDRLFVVEQEGRIKQVVNGTVSTFADLSSVVDCCEGERGLLSITLAPDYDSSGRLYVDYTGKEEPGELHVAELRAGGGSAPLSSLRAVLTIPHPGESNHNGGQLQFGPDGMLYISTGDGGGENDEHHHAQDLTSPLGKILRLDPHPVGLLPYTVPAGNPFPAAPAPANTIWSYGLRNPYRFSFDRQRGGMVIGDVGQYKREEIDYAPPGAGAGANYGWNCFEGAIVGPGDDVGCAGSDASDFISPVLDYPHADPGGGAAHGCAVIGGYVARDSSLGDLYGRYLYGDLCTGEIRSLNLEAGATSDRSEGLTLEELDSFGEDSCGRLYAISREGPVLRLSGAKPQECAVSAAAPGSTFVGLRAQSRRVKRNRRALLTAFISPCNKARFGEPVKLLRNGNHIATRRLDRACTVRFRPRISRGTSFRATIRETSSALPGSSRQLRIRIRHHRHRANQH